mgnify:CR=1 FL=1
MPDAIDWTSIWRRFWFLRGVVAAITIAALVPELTDLSRYEWLRAFHAFVVGWNLVASHIGKLLDWIPLLPELSAAEVNALLLLAAFGIPSSIAMYRRITEYRGERGHPFRAFLISVAYLFAPSFVYLFLAIPEHPIVTFMQREAIYLVGFLPESWVSREITMLSPLLVFGVISVAGFVVALFRLPGLARGFVYVISFLLILELLYWANTPFLTEIVSGFADSVLGPQPN